MFAEAEADPVLTKDCLLYTSKGKKIALVYHDSPYGQEPIPLLQKRAAKEGFELLLYPVTAPGVEQKSTWLQIRQARPAYVLLWSAGIMTPTAIREAQASGYPRDKMYAIWWAGSEGDVKDLGDVAKGYNAITCLLYTSRCV